MADGAPPQLGDIPQYSEMHIPTLSSTGNNGAASTQPTANGNSSVENTKNAVYSSEVMIYLTRTMLEVVLIGVRFPVLPAARVTTSDSC